MVEKQSDSNNLLIHAKMANTFDDMQKRKADDVMQSEEIYQLSFSLLNEDISSSKCTSLFLNTHF